MDYSFQKRVRRRKRKKKEKSWMRIFLHCQKKLQPAWRMKTVGLVVGGRFSEE